jgi:hypothetical protein
MRDRRNRVASNLITTAAPTARANQAYGGHRPPVRRTAEPSPDPCRKRAAGVPAPIIQRLRQTCRSQSSKRADVGAGAPPPAAHGRAGAMRGPEKRVGARRYTPA